jgi:dimeric dUTPase (all-alpha-NTP-PPase superfamily)
MNKFDKTLMSEAEKQRVRDNINGGLPVDMLRSLFEMQKELDQYIIEQHQDKIPTSLSEWIMKLSIAMESEIDEIRREINWKWWKPEKEINVEKLHEEISDMWHFLISMSIKAGLSADKIFEVYEKKREENFARQQGQSKDGEDYNYSEGGQQ